MDKDAVFFKVRAVFKEEAGQVVPERALNSEAFMASIGDTDAPGRERDTLVNPPELHELRLRLAVVGSS